jgi:hypothetical protein
MTSTSENNDIQNICKIISAWEQDGGETFKEFLQLNISNPMHAVKVLNTCKCCERHKKNRPSKLEKINEMPGSPYQFNKSCSCQCRHLSRFICRAFID